MEIHEIVKFKTVAEYCLTRPDPLEAARTHHGYKGHPSAYVLRYHFEDGSYLDFQISYAPIGTGVTSPCPRPNTI